MYSLGELHLRSHMAERVMLSVILHWSSIRDIRGDTITITLPPATYLIIQNKWKSLVVSQAWESRLRMYVPIMILSICPFSHELKDVGTKKEVILLH